MRTSIAVAALLTLGCNASVNADAGNKDAMIASALSAGPDSVTQAATIKDHEGNILRKGTSGWTCYPEAPAIGPMCNDAVWEAAMAAVMGKQPFDPDSVGVSYMLAGEGGAIGASNIDPFATEPTTDNDWVKEGPHMMIIVPEAAMLEGLSTDPKDPVYVMWKDTPYAHIMVRIAEEQ